MSVDAHRGEEIVVPVMMPNSGPGQYGLGQARQSDNKWNELTGVDNREYGSDRCQMARQKRSIRGQIHLMQRTIDE